MAEPDGVDGHQAPQPRTPNRYFWGQVIPRGWEIFRHWTFALTIVTTVYVYLCARWTSFGDVSIDSIRASITAYAALSFGASIGGCILILTLPSRDFIRILGSHRLKGRILSSYSDLLFVFTFSAVAQLWTIGVVIAMYGLGGSEYVLLDDSRLSHHALLLLAAAVVIFSVFRLVVVVTTLSQLGVVIEAAATRNGANDVATGDPIQDDEEHSELDVSEDPGE